MAMPLSGQLGAAQLGVAGLGGLPASSTRTISLPGIASSVAFGSMGLESGIIALPGIPTSIALGVLVVAGPISLPGIASSAAFGSLTLNSEQRVTLAGIGSGFATGTMTVSLSKTISLAGIPSTTALGALQVQGPVQFMRLAGINSGALGFLSVSGGVQDLQIFIGQIDRSANLRKLTARIQSQKRGRAVATFDLVSDGSYAPANGQTVLILDFNRKLFAGCLADRELERIMGSDEVIFHCTALDKASICDHRKVAATYAKGTESADAIRDIVRSSLNREGITTSVGVPATLGLLGSDFPFNFVPATQALDAIATDQDCDWWIDTNGELYMVPSSQAPACPFTFTETSRNWRNLKAKESLLNYRNVQYVVSNLNVLPGSGAAGITRTQDYTVNQEAAADFGFVQGAAVLDLPASAITDVSVNGVHFPAFSGYTLMDWSTVWWWFPNTPYVTAPVAGPNIPQIGDHVIITYVAAGQSVTLEAGAAFAPTVPPGITPAAGESFGTCGSGRYEAIEQVKDISTIEDLNAIAAAILARLGGIPTLISIETDVPGAAVGQRLTVDLPKALLPSQVLLITSMTGQAQGVDLGHGSTFRWQLQAASLPDIGNWIKWFERLLARGENPLPLDRFEEATFVLAPGSSLAAGVVPTNPYRVKQTGKLVEAWAICGNASVDEDLVLDCSDSALGSLFDVKKLVVPAGSLALVKATNFYQTPGYVFTDDILRASAAYNVVGPNPAPAGSITFGLRWAY